MAYKDNYRKYLEAVPDIVEQCRQSGRRTILAYTSNLDAIVKWDVSKFNEVLDCYLNEEPSFTEEENIDSMNDFARIVSFFAIHGYGGEVDITSLEVVDQIQKLFQIQYGLGGTCAQGAAALGAMEVPVVAHITDRSKEVIEWLDYPGVEGIKDMEIVPISECACEEAPLLHFIVQFTKGDIIRANGTEYEVALSNRIIMGYDQVHKVMPVQTNFLSYLESHAREVCSYDISGVNAIVDMEIMEERVEELLKHYEILKSQNQEMKIYYESAHFISPKIRDYVYSKLADCVDIMGMNEEELVDLTQKKERPIDKDDLESVLAGLDYLLDIYPVKGIVMHSKDYALYYGEEMKNVNLEMGLTLGNLMSGTRARIGRYGSPEDCKGTLQLPLSPVGVAFAEKIVSLNLKHKAMLVPSRYMEKPECTIGLGDTFVAGMQICFLR